MFALSRSSRRTLLAATRALLNSSGAFRTQPDIKLALDDLDLALTRLTDGLSARDTATFSHSGQVELALQAETDLAAQVSTLHRLLQAMGQSGDAIAQEADRMLFPDGSNPLRRPSGRAQLALYSVFANRLSSMLLPAGAVEASERVKAGIAAFSAVIGAKEQARVDLSGAVQEVVEAEAGLRDRISRLEKLAELQLTERQVEEWRSSVRALTRRSPAKKAA
jgi:hypothetical protein